MLELRCACCGVTRTFKSQHDVYNQGWDNHQTPWGQFLLAKFPKERVPEACCNLCPIVPLLSVGPSWHKEIHDEWSVRGRPEKFSIETCVPIQARPESIDPVWRALQIIRQRKETANDN